MLILEYMYHVFHFVLKLQLQTYHIFETVPQLSKKIINIMPSMHTGEYSLFDLLISIMYYVYKLKIS